jgi:cob(I)alamin adenosyltransferase
MASERNTDQSNVKAQSIHRPQGSAGCIHIYSGDGKGKTTAAIGVLTRAAGAGLRGAYIQFDKGFHTEDYYCERPALERLGVTVVGTGAQRLLPNGRFRFRNLEEDFAEAKRGLALAREMIQSREQDVIVLDEIITCVQTALLSEADVMSLLDLHGGSHPAEIILTGRGVWPALAERADLVTEMRMLRHYFEKGVALRRGIDH